MRDDFTANTKRVLAARVGHCCSNPGCRAPTFGPGSNENTIVNIGVAAHISAASAGTPVNPAPRYDETLTSAERKHISNGIWLCQNCGRLIDTDVAQFTVDLLKKWKKDAEDRAFLALTAPNAPANRIASVFGELDEDDLKFLENLSLPKDDKIEAVTERMRKAAQADLVAFQTTKAWPPTAVALNLSSNVNGISSAVSLGGLANAVGAFSTVSLVSGPGTGKSTTLVQLAGKVIEGGSAVPLLLPLGEWSGTGEDFFAFLTRRNAFRVFRQQHFQQLAFYGRLVLLIDGWNEVDAETRIQAIRQLDALRRDFTLLSVIVSTRRQAVVTPGEIVQIEPLNEEQQLEIARKFRRGSKEAILDRAWRTAGIRELISIPFYLNALLDSTPHGSFPETKEQVLSAFIARHETLPERAEILRNEVFGCHKDILIGLAVEANKLDSTTLSDEKARIVVSQIGARLASAGQITAAPQPSIVLDLLVNTHSLVRSFADTKSVSFQHQQFQEWYASFEVERLMLTAAEGAPDAVNRLRNEILNWLTWEESLLFACERLSRKDAAGTQAVSATILGTLGLDPMLAAEMIYRTNEAVWAQIKDEVIAFATRWHTPNEVDRALRFMMTTGRPEFASQVWPLVASPDNQVYLRALRKPNRFRPSVLGADVVKHLSELPDSIRGDIVAAIVFESGFDGLDLGVQIAKADSDAEVVIKIIHALEFRLADQHIHQILKNASDAVWEKLARERLRIPLIEPAQQERMLKLRAAQTAKETDPIRSILQLAENLPHGDDIGDRISTLIATEQFHPKRQNASYAVKRALENYPDQTKSALLHRIEAGLPVPLEIQECLEDIPSVDDGPLAIAALDPKAPGETARFAFTVVGPTTVGILIDELFAIDDVIRAKSQKSDEPTRNEYWRLMDAIAATRQVSFVDALLARAKSDEPHRIQLMAELVMRHGKGEGNMFTLPENLREAFAKVLEDWTAVLLTSPQANRHQMATVVQAVERLPLARFAERLDKLLKRDLADWSRAREEFKASRPAGPIPHDVTMSWTLQYQRAFAAIGGAEVVALMKRYLANFQFGIEAAIVLSAIWHKENGAVNETRMGAWHDFSKVRANRLARQDSHHPPATSDFAEAIFTTVRQLVSEQSDTDSQRHAINLATVGLRMPHGSKRADIDSLMAMPLPFGAKRQLLTAAAEAGEVIKADDLTAGLSELLEVAKKEPWRLDKNNGALMGWVEIFPFSDRPTAVIEALDKIPQDHRQPWDLDRLLRALAGSPPNDALEVLTMLVNRDKRILNNYHWIGAVFNIGTEAAADLLLDLIYQGALPGQNGFSEKRFAQLVKQHPRIRTKLLRYYATLPAGKPHSLIQSVLQEIADAEIILAFVRDYARLNKPFDGNLAYSIRETAVGKRPVAGQSNIYDEFSVSLTDLRKELFTMMLANNAVSALAKSCLNEIDELRDEYGRQDDEPRHPDLASGHAWPREAAEN